MKNLIILSLLAVAMTAAVLLVDYIDVRVLNNNNLALALLSEDYCIAFVLVAVASFFVMRRSEWFSGTAIGAFGNILMSVSFAGLWWLVTYGLWVMFHGAIGGKL